MISNSLAQVAEAHALVHANLRLVENHLRGYVTLVCEDMSLKRQDREWVRIIDESRLKDPISLKRVLDEHGKSVDHMWEIDDLIGARAVVLRLSDAAELAEELMSHPALRLSDANCNPINDEETGYRAIHIKGWLENEPQRIGCEIQIRTEVQDAWAVVSRIDIYKQQNLPPVVMELAKLQANQLAVIDEGFEVIKGLIRDYELSPKAKEKAQAELSPDVLEDSKGAGE